MLGCPRCRQRLVREESARGVQWRCPKCEGRAITLGVLRRIVRKDSVDALWRAARENRPQALLPCPMCHNAMSPVEHFGAIELDVCTTCHGAWFDPGELERSETAAPLPPPPVDEGARLSPKAREILAMAKVESLRAQAEREENLSELPPEEGWKAVLTVFGFPVEADTPALKRFPWVTVFVLILMAVGTWLAGLGNVTADWGFLPRDPFRQHGMTPLTSFFLHTSWLHFLGNAAFLYVFGDNVEDLLGHWRYAVLLILGSVSGDWLHLAFDQRGNVPLIGASGGISAVIVFYALAFPKARLVYLVRAGMMVRWVRFPAWVGLALWLGLQLWAVHRQLEGLTNVSALAHFGGVAVGVLAWLVTRRWRTGEDRNEADA